MESSTTLFEDHVRRERERRMGIQWKGGHPSPQEATVVRTPKFLPRTPKENKEAMLIAVAAGLKMRLRSADMSCAMQVRAFRCARVLLDSDSKQGSNPTRLALVLKKEFDVVYGPAWHCIVGKSFGSYVTHSSGGFVYFSADKLSFLLFKTQVQPIQSPSFIPTLKH